jgi:hypothetical protein
MGEGVVRSERPVLLNSWNRVTVYRDGWTAWMTLNGGQQISGQSQGLFTDINFRLELFLGGSPNLTLVSQRTNSFTGFMGCTRKLEINGRSYDFRSDNRGDAIDGVDIGLCLFTFFWQKWRVWKTDSKGISCENLRIWFLYFMPFILHVVYFTEECGSDVCSRTTCQNGGQCVASSPDKGICLCPLGFGGINCELGKDFLLT